MAANEDEEYALLLHKQLNAIPLRARRGQDVGAAPSNRAGRGGRPRAKRTNSQSSQEQPPSRKQRRASDPDDGHTSARQRIKREPTESHQSQPSYDHAAAKGQQHQPPSNRAGDSGDSGMVAHGGHQHRRHQLGAAGEPQHATPAQSAAAMAAAATRQLIKQQQQQQGGGSQASARAVKVFYAGVRWGVSLQPSAVKSRPLLARALNDAFAGDILSAGQGECLSVVFLDADGTAAELGPTKWAGNGKANASRWRALAKTAARIYVRGPEHQHHQPQQQQRRWQQQLQEQQQQQHHDWPSH